MILDRNILLQVEKPARYTGGEYNAVIKNHQQCDVSFAFCFPDQYEVGMSHLGLKILYHLINEREDALCERVFAPWLDMEEKMRENHIPLFSLETHTPVLDFDLVGFTLQYEMSYTNILNMLDLANIPIESSQRTKDHPLVCAGGPCAVNPEPLADFIDFFIIGDGEEVIHDVLDCIKEQKTKADDRKTVLEKLSKLEGVYVPSLYAIEYHDDGTIQKGVPTQVQRGIVKDLDQASFPNKMIVPFINVVHDRVMLEVFRGCIRGCRFCQAGYIYRPVRQRSKETLVDQACSLLESTGYEEISLTSLSTSDHTQLKPLTQELLDLTKDKQVSLSLPSLRADNFSFDLMEKVQTVRKSGLTFAPEAGTQRMRDVINKNITEENILEAAKRAFDGGWNHVKLYFMLGLPGETQEDVDGIGDLVYKILAQGNKSVQLTVSTSFFVPKPFTPFQWESQIDMDQMKEKQQLLRHRLNSRRIKYQWHDFETSRLEGVFSRGDRKLGKVLKRAWELGCKYDGWADHFRYDLWLQAFDDCKIDINFYATRERNEKEILPWDFIDMGVTKSFFIREREKAHNEITTPDCRTQCSGCGIQTYKGGHYVDCC